jgi:hypothetical protein
VNPNVIKKQKTAITARNASVIPNHLNTLVAFGKLTLLTSLTKFFIVESTKGVFLFSLLLSAIIFPLYAKLIDYIFYKIF